MLQNHWSSTAMKHLRWWMQCNAKQSPRWKKKNAAVVKNGAWVHTLERPNPTERISIFMDGWERGPAWKCPDLLDLLLPNQLESSCSHQGLFSLQWVCGVGLMRSFTANGWLESTWQRNSAGSGAQEAADWKMRIGNSDEKEMQIEKKYISDGTLKIKTGFKSNGDFSEEQESRSHGAGQGSDVTLVVTFWMAPSTGKCFVCGVAHLPVQSWVCTSYATYLC